MWKYIKQYLPYAILAGLFMIGEVSMDLIQPGIMSRIVDDGVLGLNNGGVGDLGLIWELGIRMVVLVLFGGLCGALNNVFVHMSGQNIGNEMRKDCFRRIMTFSFPQLDRFGTGSLVTRVTNDITQVQNLVSQFVRGMIRTSMLMFGSMYCMFRLNRDFGLIVLCAFPLIVGCLAFCMAKANPLFSKLQAQLDDINAIMQEDVSGIRIIKACVRETYEKVRFGKANDELIKTQLRVLMLVLLFQNISRGIASWKRVKEVLHSETELKDGTLAGTGGRQGVIEFRDVSFAYPGSSHMVLDHINLTVHQGETLAVMGATGCGKTSLAGLIPRFYDVTEGSVLVDGFDVREYRQKELREKVSVVLQKSELFSTTIRENIAWGAPEAEEETIKAAAVTAQADSFISSTPDGYDTVVAERGMSLSGGQKQRISIARAVLKPAEILIFDDSTSALDLKTEADLYAALKKSNPQSTKIIIAQRIASVRRADRIVVLENGRITACGSHEELMKSSAAYQDIYHSQIGEGDEKHECA